MTSSLRPLGFAGIAQASRDGALRITCPSANAEDP
jgi:hypothetical protein